ncbi:MAG: hypothetical protein Q9198_007873, partial [Flavoplaca austrocitrina]
GLAEERLRCPKKKQVNWTVGDDYEVEVLQNPPASDDQDLWKGDSWMKGRQ